jgi:ligand-binding sensor domain-containing protein
MGKIFIIISFLLFVILSSCEKEDSYRIFNEVPFEMDEQILDGFFVTAIDFDSKGTAWIGTFNQGLLKYDNGLLTIYNSENSPFDSSYIYDIAIDKNDDIWVGTNGLVKYDGEHFTKYDNTNTIMPENFVNSIAIDNNNHIWFSSSRFGQGGLIKYDGNSWKQYTPNNSGLPCHFILDIVTDGNNNIWVALGEKVNNVSMVKINNENWTSVSSDDFGFDPYYWGDLEVKTDNSIVASIDYGFSSLMDISRPNIIVGKNGNWKVNSPSDNGGNSLGYVRTICCDNSGFIWAALDINPEYKKLAVFNGQKWYVNNDNLETGDIFVMKADKHNRVWLGTGSGIQIVKSAE